MFRKDKKMAPERKSLFLFLFLVFALSFLYMMVGVSSHTSQSDYGIYKNRVHVQEKQVLNSKTASLTFDVKKDNRAKKSSRSGFCKKTSKSIFDDMIVRNIDTTFHFKIFEIRLQHFEYKKDAVYNNLFSCYTSNCDLYIHSADYYIFTLRKIIT